jgi:hypothetical protein
MDSFLFQQYGIKWLAERKSGLLCDDPGLGKTLQAIRAADKAKLRKILTLTPAIARLNPRSGRDLLRLRATRRRLGHLAPCRLPLFDQPAGPSAKHPSGEWAGPYGSRIEAIGAAEKVFGCRVRACRFCNLSLRRMPLALRSAREQV